ncbi:MAG: hypothetical protein AB1486_34515 [Planctomycetota bacterium]
MQFENPEEALRELQLAAEASSDADEYLLAALWRQDVMSSRHSAATHGALRAVWDFTGDMPVFGGCALRWQRQAPELQHRQHSKGRFIAPFHNRKELALYAHVREQRKARLLLEHCAASVPAEPFGGQAAIKVLVNNQAVDPMTVTDHTLQKDPRPVGHLLQPGRNELVIRFESGPSEYWLASVALEEED